MSFTTPLNLSSLNGSNGFRLDGVAAADRSGWSVASAGDVNGDGFADIILGAYDANVPARLGAGASYVVFGSAGGWNATINLASLNGTNGFRLDGGAAGESSGFSVASAGDMNGDGLSDLIVGANDATPNSRTRAGSSYIVFGKESAWDATVDLATLDGSNGFRLNGLVNSSQLGNSVASAGDVNGDGLADIIIGASNAAGGGLLNPPLAGSSYVLFGRTGGWSASIDVPALNGSNGFHLGGAVAGDSSGVSVASAGDVNGDGFADLIVGASGADPINTDSGAAYVVFGRASGWAASASLGTLNGSNGFRLAGVADRDFAGTSVAAAGDVNGDGFGDVIVGAPSAGSGVLRDAGSSYVVFGKASGWTASFDLSTLDGSNGFRLDGVVAEDAAGRSVAAAGDVNGDGFADLIIGAPSADVNSEVDAGASYLVLGRASGWAATVNLGALNGSDGFQLSGVAISDGLGLSVASAGDVDGDGFADLILGAYNADPPGRPIAGSSYVVFSAATGPGTYRGTTLADVLRGTPDNDVMNGHGQHDRLFGRLGHDTINGGAGDDTLDGGGGDDSIVGGLGTDTASYASATAAVLVSLALSGAQDTRGAGIDVLSGIENLLGSGFNDTLVASGGQVAGGDGDDVLFGTGANERLSGGAGRDTLLASGLTGTTMAGGAGDDVYQANRATDTIEEAAGGGFDIVFFTASSLSVLAEHVEAGYLVGDAVDLIGTAANDVLVANPTRDSSIDGREGDDELWAGAGSDSMLGGAGHDVLRGWGGIDTMIGGTGDDTYVLTSSAHVIIEVGGQGFDTVYQTTASWAVSPHIEVVRLFGDGVSVTGTTAADMLVANAGAASTLNGKGGSDTIWGQGQADLLDGGAADDVLRGGGGNDTLVGGLGDDQLVGGAGADRFAFNAPGWGFDTVHDFNRGQGDRIDMTGSAVSGFGALAVQVIGPNTMLLFEASRIDVYGVTNLSAGDFIFG